jgi:hypothetical protein
MKHIISTNKNNRGQEGMASIISALIIVILLSLISIGFAKIMSRSLENSVNSHLASAADYAAQSGINDAMAYINANGVQPVTSCNALNGSGGPPKSIKFQLSGDTKYTCILISPSSPNLLDTIKPYTSSVEIVQGASRLTLSWQSPDDRFSLLPKSGGKFLDETTWHQPYPPSDKGYAPVLRVTLYPLDSFGDMAGVQGQSETYFLYPTSDGSTDPIVFGAGSDGLTKYIKCGNDSADYQCNATITGFSSRTKFYVRLTPLYDKADTRIEGTDETGKQTQFSSQITVDVTAQSGGATKRLQVRLSKTPPEIPEYALRTTNLLCKRLTVAPDPYGLGMDLGNVTTDDCTVPAGTGTGGPSD